MSEHDFTRAEVCAVAIAESVRGDGEIMVSPFGFIPMLGTRLAKLTFEPDLVLTDGLASIQANVLPIGNVEAPEPVVEGWMPFRTVFDTLWAGRRHVIMGAAQVDRFGNQNLACIGPFEKPQAQLIGMRGSPGNTINHRTSYWVPKQSRRCFVEKVDVVCGVGYDRAATLAPASRRFHDIHQVITNLGVFDFDSPDRSMRLRSLHPGVELEDVIKATGFDLVIPDDVPETRAPSDEELRLIREVLDPSGARTQEVEV